MAKKQKEKEKKKPIFDKVGLVFRSPVRADIMRELSLNVQKPQEIADKIAIPKQNVNYHLQALKKGGLIKTHTEERDQMPSERGVRIDEKSESGKYKVSYGVELTKNGKNIVNQFIDPLYEEENENEINKNNEKEED
ncbi:MAG: winged helix-turn-helix domain-containing protein [Candidatus Hodarchaeota archaeon]